MYVYLPPGYDKCQRYPLMILLHGFVQDERLLLTVAPVLDEAIACGKLPPLIIACPDGTIHGEPNLLAPGSFFLNSKAGDFEDFITIDVWDFLIRHYSIRAEREAHVLAGVSMGGFGAYNLAIRHRDAFGVAVGVFPPLNLRWVDDKDRYHAKFDPHHWGWRTSMDRRLEAVARLYGGLVTIRYNELVRPQLGTGDEARAEITRQNPIELVGRRAP